MKKFTTFETQLGESVVLTDKAKLSLYKKSQNSGYSIDILEEVYRRGHSIWNESFGGTPDSFAFDRVNSFISGGFAEMLDKDLINEKRGLWDNIHAKRARIKAGSGERMRKPGSEGAPTDAALKASQNEDTDPCWKGYKQVGMKKKGGREVPNCVSVKEELNKKVMTPERIADKHDVSVESIMKALKKGIEVEKEHTTHNDEARRIALAHLAEKPDYYTKLNKAGLEEDAEKHSKDFTKPSSRFIGSDELTDIYKQQTPGQIIKRVVKEHLEEAAMYMPPPIEQPSIQRPAPQRQFSRSVQNVQGRMGSGAGAQSARVQIQRAAPARAISSRMSGQGGSMTGQVQTQRAAAPRAPTSSMPSAQGGSMTAKPTVTKGVEATKFTVQKGMSAAGKEAATKAVEKAIPAAAGRAAGGLLRTALGPAGAAAAAVMEPTPAGEKMSEFQRQDTLKKYNPFKSQGRSIADYEKQQVTRKIASAPTADEAPKPKVTADVPTPPSRPEYMSRGQAFQAARSEVGGAGGKFSYGGKEFQTNVSGEKYVAKPTTTSVKDETESGGIKKKIKEAIAEATYKGKTVPLNKPMKGDVKKSKVYVDPDGDGKAQKVNFGDKNMTIKKDQPARKKSYCARSSGQGNLTDKTSANYWSRRAWNCEETQVDETKKVQGYQNWPGEKKKKFFQGPKDKDGKTETQKWAERKQKEREVKQVDEVWSTAPQRRSFTLGKRDAEATPEQRAKVKEVIKNMKVPGPAGETPEAREARMARNKARQMAAVGLGEEN